MFRSANNQIKLSQRHSMHRKPPKPHIVIVFHRKHWPVHSLGWSVLSTWIGLYHFLLICSKSVIDQSNYENLKMKTWTNPVTLEPRHEKTCLMQCMNNTAWESVQSEPPHDKTNKMACAPGKDSDQTGHLPSLIRVFAVRMKKAWVLSYPLSAQRRLWSDWADAQADLSLRWAHSRFVGFDMMRLICGLLLRRCNF